MVTFRPEFSHILSTEPMNIRLRGICKPKYTPMIDFPLTETTALTPLDGRYGSKVADLRPIFSEFGLIKYRSLVEVRWLQALSNESNIAEVPAFSGEANAQLDAIISNFSVADAEAVKTIEATTNHDVKAVEYFLKQSSDSIDELVTLLTITLAWLCWRAPMANRPHRRP